MGKGDGLGSTGGGSRSTTHSRHNTSMSHTSMFSHKSNHGFGSHKSHSHSSFHHKPHKSTFHSSSTRHARSLTAEELAVIQQQQANIAAVTYKLDSHPNLKNYIDSNPVVARQLWRNHEVVRRMNEEPSLMAEMDVNPEYQIQSLFQQHPMPQKPSLCCTIV